MCGVTQLTAEDIEAMSAIKKGHRRLILAGIAKAKAQGSNNVSPDIADINDTDGAEAGGNAPTASVDTSAAHVAATERECADEDAGQLLSLSPALFEDMESPVDAVCDTLDAFVAELKRSIGPAEGTEMIVAEGRAQTLQELLRSQEIDDDDCHELMDLTHALAHRDFDAALVVYRLIEAEGADSTDDVTRGSWVEGLGVLLRLSKVLAEVETETGETVAAGAVTQETNAEADEHEMLYREQHEHEPLEQHGAGDETEHDEIEGSSGALTSEDSGLQAADDVPDF